MALIAPTGALASTGCDAVNSGRLNMQAGWVSGSNTPTGNAREPSSGSIIQALKSAASSITAPRFDSTLVTFDAGDLIHYSFSSSGVNANGGTGFAYHYGASTNGTNFVSPVVGGTAFTTDRNATADQLIAANTSAVQVYVSRSAPGFGQFTITATCTAAGGGGSTPVLGLSLTHTGTPAQGGTAALTAIVANTGPVITSANIVLTGTLPAGLSFVSAGTGGGVWDCGASSGVNLSCTFTGTIHSGSTSNPLTITAAIASNAGTPLNLTVSASGGGASNTPTATDSILVAQTSPTISTVVPGQGIAKAGTPPASVTITGTNFDPTPANNTVSFGGSAGTVTGGSATSLTVTPPARATQAIGNVTVTSGPGRSATLTNGYRWVEPPKVTAAFGATSIASGGSTTLTLTVSNPNAVLLGGVTIAPQALPSGLTGSLAGGTCGAGAVSGNAVSLNATNLSDNGSCTVIVTVTSTTPNTYSYTTGAIAASGADTTAFALPGDAATTPTGLTVTSSANADLSNLVLSQGTLNPGFGAGTTSYTASVAAAVTSLDVTPTVADPGATVRINGVSATSGSPRIAALVPGPNTITVRVTAQDTITTKDYVVTVTRAIPVPTLTSLSSPSANAAGGNNGGTANTLTLTGQDFTNANAVHFGSATLTGGAFTIVNDTTITLTVPTGAAAGVTGVGGVVDVSVASSAGTSSAQGFTYLLTPTINALATPSNNNTLVFTGTAMPGARIVLDITGPSPLLTNTIITDGGGAWSYTRPGALDGSYTAYIHQSIAAANSDNSNTIAFEIDTAAPVAPIVITPANGSTTGTTPTFSGTAEPNITVTLIVDGTPVGTTSSDASGNWSKASAALSVGAHTIGTIAADVAGNTSPASNTNTFTVASMPAVTGLSPAAGNQAGGGTVTITGTNLSGATAVDFGGTPATSLTPVNASTLRVTAPAGTGTVDVHVTTPAGTSAPSAGDRYTYFPVPAVTSISPDSGPTAGSTAVTLTGTNLAGATLTVDGASVTPTSTTPTSLTFSTPGHAAGPVTIAVATGGGTASIGYSYVAAPAAAPVGGVNVIFETAKAIDLSGAISGTHASIAIGTAPAHGTTAIAGDVVTYTPAAGYAGTDSFTYTATGPGGTSSPATVDMTVLQGTQTISFAALADASLSASPLTLSASAGSGLAVAFTSATPAICSVSGTTLTLLLAGTCTIDADQAGDASYAAAPTVSRSFTVTPADLVIATNAASGTMVGGTYDQANPASGGVAPYHYALASGTLPAGTTLDPASGRVSGTPTIAGAFSYAIQATDSQGTPVTATGSTVSGTIAQGTQTISFTSTAPAAAAVGGASYTVGATASSGLGVSFSLDGASTGCALSGSTVTFTSTGTCVIDASQAGDANWSPAAQAQQSFAVGAAGAVSLGIDYAPTPLASGASGTLTLTFTNPNATPTPAFSSALHSNDLVFTRTPGLGGSCGIPVGSTSVPTTAQVNFANIQIPAGTCTVTLPYRAAAPGTASWTFDAFTPLGYPATAGATSNTATVLPSVTSISPATGPAGQVVTIDGTGFSTTPGNNIVHFGGDTGTVTAASATQLTVTAPATGTGAVTVTVTVGGQTSTNSDSFTFIDKPVAADKSGIAVPYASTGTAIDLSASITGGPHTAIAIGTAPAHGTTTIAGDVVTYTPASGYFGADSFTYTATGPGGTSAAATVTLSVANPAAPVAADKSGVAVPYAGTGTAIDLSASVTGVHTAIAIGTAPAHGTTTIAGDVVTYTPAATYYGADSFTYTATGPGGTSAAATVTLSVANPAAPVAADKSGVAVPYAGTGTAIDLSGSVTGVHTAIAIGTAPAHGTTTIAGDVVTYTPASGYFGADSFTYTATGPGGTSNVATVSLTVATPATPVAADKSGVAVPYASTGTTIDLSASVTGVHTAIAIGTAPAHGTATIAGDVVTYTPASGYFGADSFTYTATGPGGTSNVATVSLTVATPATPVAADKSGVAVPYASTGTAIDLSASVTGIHTAIAIGTAPAHGTATIAGDVVTYTPAATYYGADSFTYTATGPGGTSNVATVSLTVATPATPVAADKSGVAVPYASTGTAIDLSASVTGIHTAIAIGTAPAHGTATIAGDVVTYTPASGYFGADSFTYTATGPGGTSAQATVTLSVATPPAPTVADKPGVAVPYASTGTAIDLSASVTGVHSAIAIGTAPAHGTTTIAGDVVTYTPASGYYGADSFTYTATGPGGTSAAATVTLSVATPPAPTVADKPGVAVPYASTGTTIDLSASVTGGPHTAIAIGTAPAHGTATIAGDVVTYTPASGYYGADSFTYTATGPGGTSAAATVGLSVATPAAPIAADKSGVAVPYASTGTAIDLSASITGVHSAIAIGTAPAHGTATIAGDVVTYTPASGYYGTDSFTYTATGPGGTSAAATVGLSVATPPAPSTADKSGVAVGYDSAGTAIDLSASVTGVHTAIAIGTAPAHGTATIAGDVVTYTPAATYYGADSFTYTATGPGGTSAAATVTLSVATPPAPSTADKSGVAVPYASAGTAIDLSASVTGVHTAIAIGTAPAHGTATIAGDVVTYTPASGYYGTDSFTYTATGPGGTSPAATVTLSVATPPAPTAADKPGVAVPYASAGTAIDLSASVTGIHTAIAIGTAPAHGTVTIAGDVVTYTPASGYFGTDSFTYTATGPGGTSAQATVTLSVATPAAPSAASKSGVAVPYASAGTAIDLSGSVTGVHTAIAIGTAPAHGTTTIAGDVVTYTPASGYFGADSFTYTATGPGGTSAAATVTLSVATPAAPSAADKSGVAVGYDSAGTAIDLSGSITGVHTAIAIGTAPAHGTATVHGDVVTYVPTSGYFGADSFTYTATGPGGTSAAATVSLGVATPPPPIAAPGAGSVAGRTTTAGSSVSIDLSALVTGVYDTIHIDTPPAHGTVTLSGGTTAMARGAVSLALAAPTPYIATYTPAVNFAGTDSFTFVAVGPGGSSSPGTVTITVVGQVPEVPARTAQTGDGQSVSVMLSDGARGGPFTAANVVNVTPAGAATTAIVASGSGPAAAYRLDVTPNNRFGGTIVVTYTLSNIFGTSAPSTVTLTVEARPDPRNDPDVGAISDAQAEAARRFARAQVSNFMRRNEQLHHGGGRTGMDMGMTLSSRDASPMMQRPDDRNWGLAITERMRMSGEDPAIGRYANDAQSPLARGDQLGNGRMFATDPHSLGGTGAPGAPARSSSPGAPGTAPARSDDVGEDGKRRIGSLATWAGGSIDIGTRDATTDRSKVTATTAGLSAGADIKLADGVLVGLGGGYGNDLSRIGTAAQVRSKSTLYAAYASIQPSDTAFIDAMIGRGGLDFTTRRIAAAVNSTAIGNRNGTYTVGAISAGIDRNSGALQWSLYGRGEYMGADLDAYAETGAGRYNLRFDTRQVESITGTLGGRIEYRQKVGFGSVTPRLRAEWNHEFADVDAQWLDYADIPGNALYSLSGNGWKREQLQVSLGARFDILKGAWSFDFETGLRTGQGEKAGTLQLRLSKEF